MDKQEILKLTVPKLRETAMKEIESIAGVHGMNKGQLIEVLFDHFGIAPDAKATKKVDPMIKKKMKELRVKKLDLIKAGDKKKANGLRRKIHRLKRTTRG